MDIELLFDGAFLCLILNLFTFSAVAVNIVYEVVLDMRQKRKGGE